MPYSHHSHSGEFCGHATNTLEEVVKSAIERKMEVFALTEHMPREEEDLYPEEISTSQTEAKLAKLFHDYVQEATRMKKLYAAEIKILVGLEIDWIRPSSKAFVEDLLQKYHFDLFVGSVHHVHAIPIDYDYNLYAKACEISKSSEERLAEDYFDSHYQMLQALQPPIVGHFDLIRLKSSEPNASLTRWKRVWQKILRNLDYIAGYGGTIELSSAAVRKGLNAPYPEGEICKAFLAKGGHFTLSDDSHGVNQVGTYYREVLEFAAKNNITTITYFENSRISKDDRFPRISTRTATITDLKNHAFFG